MSKDPATLWYWNDWNGGTMTLSRHLKGCYMDLLSAQFNSGPLSLEQIKTVLGTDQASWTVLSKKFKKVVIDDVDHFFNERMEAEKERRQQHSKKQSENVKKRWDKYGGNTNVYTKTIPLETETENIIKTALKKNVIETLFTDLTENELNQAFEFMFHLGRKEISKEDIKHFWVAFKTHKPESSLESRGKQMQHFRDWLKFQKKVDVKKQEKTATVYNIEEQVAKYK